MSETDTTTTSTIEDPLPNMFTQYQKRSIEKGRKWISYSKEYKLAAIDRFKSGRSR